MPPNPLVGGLLPDDDGNIEITLARSTRELLIAISQSVRLQVQHPAIGARTFIPVGI